MVNPNTFARNPYQSRSAALVLNPVLSGSNNKKALQQLSHCSKSAAANLPQADLGATRSSMCSFVTRSSVASAENKILREQNADLLNQLNQIKGQQSGRTVRSKSSFGSTRRSLTSSNSKSLGSTKTSLASSVPTALDSTANTVFRKLHEKPNAFKRLLDTFKQRDKMRTGTISMRELHSGLEVVGVLDCKLSDTVLYEIFSLCPMDFTGEIAYRDFVVKVKAIRLPKAGTLSRGNIDTQVFLVPRPVPKLKGFSTMIKPIDYMS